MTNEKRIERLESALWQIEQRSTAAIDKYGIMNQPAGPPEAWTTRINAILETVSPIRDIARKGLKP